MKDLQNEARKQKSVKEVTLQFSIVFQIRLKNNTVNFRVICPSLLRSVVQGLSSSHNNFTHSAMEAQSVYVQLKDIVDGDN